MDEGQQDSIQEELVFSVQSLVEALEGIAPQVARARGVLRAADPACMPPRGSDLLKEKLAGLTMANAQLGQFNMDLNARLDQMSDLVRYQAEEIGRLKDDVLKLRREMDLAKCATAVRTWEA